jgi:hypothetical protein
MTTDPRDVPHVESFRFAFPTVIDRDPDGIVSAIALYTSVSKVLAAAGRPSLPLSVFCRLALRSGLRRYTMRNANGNRAMFFLGANLTDDAP